METVAPFLFLFAGMAVVAATFALLIKPSLIKRGGRPMPRKTTFFGGIGAVFVCFVGLAIAVPKVSPQSMASKTNTGQVTNAATAAPAVDPIPVSVEPVLAQANSGESATASSVVDTQPTEATVTPVPSNTDQEVTALDPAAIKAMGKSLRAILREFEGEERKLESAFNATGGKWSKAWRAFATPFIEHLAESLDRKALEGPLVASTVDQRARRELRLYLGTVKGLAIEYNSALSFGKGRKPDSKWFKEQASGHRIGAAAAIALLARGENDPDKLELSSGSEESYKLAPSAESASATQPAPATPTPQTPPATGGTAFAAALKVQLKKDLSSADVHFEQKGFVKYLFVALTSGDWMKLEAAQRKDLLEALIRGMKDRAEGSETVIVSVGNVNQTFGEAKWGPMSGKPTIELP